MIEKFNRLLDDEQQLVLQRAELYIHDPEKKLSISYLQSELGVSRHQVLMAFDLLKDTVASLNLKNIDLAYDGKGIIAMYGLTTSLLKQLLEEMALRSIRLNVFINSQLGIYGTQAQFTKRFGISRATYYRNIMGIRQLFTEEIFNYRSLTEARLRQVLFSVIHHFLTELTGSLVNTEWKYQPFWNKFVRIVGCVLNTPNGSDWLILLLYKLKEFGKGTYLQS
ncbi:hypothetical protein [Pediococcus acidilactici]|uniref:hypothetical protein n=1 Tax=Pediococcus acidilactici TaxID=1254 RepID=UPI001F1E4B1E|nr:hypothetical protein [Pediococcus acidilactici]